MLEEHREKTEFRNRWGELSEKADGQLEGPILTCSSTCIISLNAMCFLTFCPTPMPSKNFIIEWNNPLHLWKYLMLLVKGEGILKYLSPSLVTRMNKMFTYHWNACSSKFLRANVINSFNIYIMFYISNFENTDSFFFHLVLFHWNLSKHLRIIVSLDFFPIILL